LLSVLFFERLARQTSTLFPYTTLFRSIIRDCVKVVPKVDEPSITDRIDDILTHKVWGFAIFFLVLLFIFQAIFSWAEYPMALIRSEEHTSELQSRENVVCRLLLEKKKV